MKKVFITLIMASVFAVSYSAEPACRVSEIEECTSAAISDEEMINELIATLDKYEKLFNKVSKKDEFYGLLFAFEADLKKLDKKFEKEQKALEEKINAGDKKALALKEKLEQKTAKLQEAIVNAGEKIK